MGFGPISIKGSESPDLTDWAKWVVCISFWHSMFFCFAGIQQMQVGDGVRVREIRCQLQHSVSHFGDFCTLLVGGGGQ